METFDLSYEEIKRLSNNSLAYTFTDNRAALLAELDARFTAFEAAWRADHP